MEEFLNRAKDIHGTKYDYSRVFVDGVYNNVEIICPSHGSFMQSPTKHLNSAHGCPKCGANKRPYGGSAYKEYIFPSGRKNRIQGYENYAIDWLLMMGYLEDDIILEDKNSSNKI